MGWGDSNRFIRPYKTDLVKEKSKAVGRPSLALLLLYIALINAALFVTGIGLHELGHLAVGQAYGCEEGKIVFFDNIYSFLSPYTEITCPTQVQESILAMGGFFFIVPFGFLFLFLKRLPERNFSFIVFGLSIILSGLDLLFVFPGTYATHFAIFAGMLLVSLGEMSFIHDYTKPISLEKEINSPLILSA